LTRVFFKADLVDGCIWESCPCCPARAFRCSLPLFATRVPPRKTRAVSRGLIELNYEPSRARRAV